MQAASNHDRWGQDKGPVSFDGVGEDDLPLPFGRDWEESESMQRLGSSPIGKPDVRAGAIEDPWGVGWEGRGGVGKRQGSLLLCTPTIVDQLERIGLRGAHLTGLHSSSLGFWGGGRTRERDVGERRIALYLD